MDHQVFQLASLCGGSRLGRRKRTSEVFESTASASNYVAPTLLKHAMLMNNTSPQHVGRISPLMCQVLRPVCEELRKRAASRGGPEGEGEGVGGEEDTFVSLRTSRRTLDLKFSTVPTRYGRLSLRRCLPIRCWCAAGFVLLVRTDRYFSSLVMLLMLLVDLHVCPVRVRYLFFPLRYHGA